VGSILLASTLLRLSSLIFVPLLSGTDVPNSVAVIIILLIHKFGLL
jgi:hypothetical protein